MEGYLQKSNGASVKITLKYANMLTRKRVKYEGHSETNAIRRFSWNFVTYVIKNWRTSLVWFKTYKYLKTVCVLNTLSLRYTHSKYTLSLPLTTVRWEDDDSSVGQNYSGYEKSLFINYEYKCN